MDYKKCNIFIEHNGLTLNVTGIRKWDTTTLYYDLKNEGGYIGFIKEPILRFTNAIESNGELIKFYKTI